MKKFSVFFCTLFLLFAGCTAQPTSLQQTPILTEMPTPEPTEFVPAPLEPAELTQEQWEQMKNTKTCMTTDGAMDLSPSKTSTTLHNIYLSTYFNNPNAFRYVDYYGTYQGYIALRLHNMQFFLGKDKEEVAGCTFYYSGCSDILFCRVVLWKDDTFYHLQYAYDQSLLTEEDIKNIAYYNNLRHFEPIVSASPIPYGPTSMPEDFVPAPLEPAELNKDVWARIHNTYQYVFDGEFWKSDSLPFQIHPADLRYCGTYQDYIAIFIRSESPYIDLISKMDNAIYLWKDDVFYHFQDALNLGLISDQDAKNIIYYHNVYYYKN